MALLAVCAAILYNPAFEIELGREAWQFVDFVAAMVFGWLSLQRYAFFSGKPWLPFVPTAALVFIVIAGAVISSGAFHRSTYPNPSYAISGKFNDENFATDVGVEGVDMDTKNATDIGDSVYATNNWFQSNDMQLVQESDIDISATNDFLQLPSQASSQNLTPDQGKGSADVAEPLTEEPVEGVGETEEYTLTHQESSFFNYSDAFKEK